jgi:hypothetical protein
MSHDEIAGLAAGYALSALDADDLKLFEAHLATCPECTASVAELRPLVDGLSGMTEEFDPPGGLRARIIAAARSEPQVSTPAREAKPAKTTPWWRRPVLWPLPVGAVITALVLVLVVVSVWGSQNDDDFAAAQRRLNLSYDGLEIMGQADHWWRFNGSGSASAAAGSLAYATYTGTACLLVWGLPVGEEMVYQARLTESDGTVSLLKMWYDDAMWLILDGDPSRLKKLDIILSLEGTSPPAGSPAMFEVPLTSS